MPRRPLLGHRELLGVPAALPASELVPSPAAAFGPFLAARTESHAWLRVHHTIHGFQGDAGFCRGDMERKVLKGDGAVCRGLSISG